MKPSVCSIERRPLFKRCTHCGTEWSSCDDFLSDAGIIYIGYQSHFDEQISRLFYFNHNCKGTMGIVAEKFNDSSLFRMGSRLIDSSFK